MPHRLLPACLLVLAACRAPRTPTEPRGDPREDATVETGAPDVTGEAVPRPLQTDPVFDALFDRAHVVDVRISLPDASRAALDADPRTYVTSGVAIDGVLLENVGVQLKGSSSFQDFSGKPSFKLRFDAFEEGRTLGKMHRLTLNNMVQDPSQAREMLTYWFWARAGGTAPAVTYARVHVNDALFGLYALVEPMDQDFLARRYAYPDGDLWEGADGADLTPSLVGGFELKSGEGDRRRLAEVAARVVAPTPDFHASLDADVVMDDALDYWALQMATACLDAYPYNLNDWYLYADPGEGGRLRLSPWGMDESWNPTFVFQWGVGKLLFNCAADAACLSRVKERVHDKLDALEAVDAAGELARIYALGAAEVANDPRRGWTPVEVETARADLSALVQRWPDTLRAQLAAAR